MRKKVVRIGMQDVEIVATAILCGSTCIAQCFPAMAKYLSLCKAYTYNIVIIIVSISIAYFIVLTRAIFSYYSTFGSWWQWRIVLCIYIYIICIVRTFGTIEKKLSNSTCISTFVPRLSRIKMGLPKK